MSAQEAKARWTKDAETIERLQAQLQEAQLQEAQLRAARLQEARLQEHEARQVQAQLDQVQKRAEEDAASAALVKAQLLRELETQLRQKEDAVEEVQGQLRKAQQHAADMETTSRDLRASVLEGEKRVHALTLNMAAVAEESERLRGSFQSQHQELARANAAAIRAMQQQAASDHDEDMKRYSQQCEQKVQTFETFVKQQEVEIGRLNEVVHAATALSSERAHALEESARRHDEDRHRWQLEQTKSNEALEQSRMAGEELSLQLEQSRMAGEELSLQLEKSRMAGEELSLQLEQSRMAGEELSLQLATAAEETQATRNQLVTSKKEGDAFRSKCEFLSAELVVSERKCACIMVESKTHTESLLQQVQDLKEEYGVVSRQLASSEVEVALARTNGENLRKDVARAASQLQLAESQRAALSEQLMKCTEDLKQANHTCEKLTHDLLASKSEMDMLGATVTSSRAQCVEVAQQLETSKAECETLARQIVATEEAAARQLEQQQVVEVDARQKLVLSLQSDLAASQRAEQMSSRLLEEKKKDIAQLQLGHTSMLASMEEALQSKLAQKERAQARERERVRKAGDALQQSYQEKLRLEQSASAALSQKVRELEADLDSERQGRVTFEQHSLQSYEDVVARFDKAVEAMETSKRACEARSLECEELRCRLQKSEAETDELASQMTTVLDQNESLRKEFGTFQEEKEKEVRSLEDQLAHSNDKRNQSNMELEDLNVSAAGKMSALREELNRAFHRDEASQARIRETEATLADLHRHKDQAAQQNEALMAQLDTLRRAFQAEAAERKAHVDRYHVQHRSLQAKVTRAAMSVVHVVLRTTPLRSRQVSNAWKAWRSLVWAEVGAWKQRRSDAMRMCRTRVKGRWVAASFQRWRRVTWQSASRQGLLAHCCRLCRLAHWHSRTVRVRKAFFVWRVLTLQQAAVEMEEHMMGAMLSERRKVVVKQACRRICAVGRSNLARVLQRWRSEARISLLEEERLENHEREKQLLHILVTTTFRDIQRKVMRAFTVWRECVVLSVVNDKGAELLNRRKHLNALLVGRLRSLFKRKGAFELWSQYVQHLSLQSQYRIRGATFALGRLALLIRVANQHNGIRTSYRVQLGFQKWVGFVQGRRAEERFVSSKLTLMFRVYRRVLKRQFFSEWKLELRISKTAKCSQENALRRLVKASRRHVLSASFSMWNVQTARSKLAKLVLFRMACRIQTCLSSYFSNWKTRAATEALALKLRVELLVNVVRGTCRSYRILRMGSTFRTWHFAARQSTVSTRVGALRRSFQRSSMKHCLLRCAYHDLVGMTYAFMSWKCVCSLRRCTAVADNKKRMASKAAVKMHLVSFVSFSRQICRWISACLFARWVRHANAMRHQEDITLCKIYSQWRNMCSQLRIFDHERAMALHKFASVLLRGEVIQSAKLSAFLSWKAVSQHQTTTLKTVEKIIRRFRKCLLRIALLEWTTKASASKRFEKIMSMMDQCADKKRTRQQQLLSSSAFETWRSNSTEIRFRDELSLERVRGEEVLILSRILFRLAQDNVQKLSLAFRTWVALVVEYTFQSTKLQRTVMLLQRGWDWDSKESLLRGFVVWHKNALVSSMYPCQFIHAIQKRLCHTRRQISLRQWSEIFFRYASRSKLRAFYKWAYHAATTRRRRDGLLEVVPTVLPINNAVIGHMLALKLAFATWRHFHACEREQMLLKVCDTQHMELVRLSRKSSSLTRSAYSYEVELAGIKQELLLRTSEAQSLNNENENLSQFIQYANEDVSTQLLGVTEPLKDAMSILLNQSTQSTVYSTSTLHLSSAQSWSNLENASPQCDPWPRRLSRRSPRVPEGSKMQETTLSRDSKLLQAVSISDLVQFQPTALLPKRPFTQETPTRVFADQDATKHVPPQPAAPNFSTSSISLQDLVSFHKELSPSSESSQRRHAAHDSLLSTASTCRLVRDLSGSESGSYKENNQVISPNHHGFQM